VSLISQLHHFARSPIVAHIVVVWHDPSTPPPPPQRRGSVLITFLWQECDSLNNRFNPSNRITTRAVVTMDDDQLPHLEDLELLFAAWRAYPSRIVGFYPGGHRPDDHPGGRARVQVRAPAERDGRPVLVCADQADGHGRRVPARVHVRRGPARARHRGRPL
jgi:hypothetical protein